MAVDILTIDEVAAMLKMNRRQVLNLIGPRASRPLPVIRLSPKNLRFSRAAVEEWVLACSE